MAAGREAERLQQAAAGFVDLLADVGRHDLAVAFVHVGVGEGRVGDRHLQRVGQQVALADGEVHVVADAPGAHFADDRAAAAGVFVFAGDLALVLAPAPGRVGDDAFELARQVDAGVLPDPELMGLVLDHVAVGVGALADFEEVGVRGDLQRLHEPDGAVVGFAGVAELLGRDGDALARPEAFFGRDHAAFERRHGGDRLEGRAGRIGAVDGPVGERPGCRAGALELFVFVLGERFGEAVGVERGVGADREDFAVARIHRHERPGDRRFAAGAGVVDALQERLFALLLQAQVERHLQRRGRPSAGSGRAGWEPGSRSALTSTRSTPGVPRR